MNNKNIAIAILSGLVALLLFRNCASTGIIHDQEAQNKRYKLHIDSLNGWNEIDKTEIGILQNEVTRLTDMKTPKVEVLYQYKYLTQYVRIKDTFRQRFTDSNYCKNIELENIKLWEVYGIDSVLIENYKRIVLNQDSIINRDSVMMGICNKAWNEESKARKKSDAKLNHKSFWLEAWRGIAVASVGLLAYVGLSK